MDESETRSIELHSGEARKIISALATAKEIKSHREEMTNIQRQFQAEFDLGERGDNRGTGPFGTILGESQENTNPRSNTPTGGSGSRSIELSRGEAETVITALSKFETNQSDAEETTHDLREQFKSKFSLDRSEGESDEGLL